MLVDELSSVAGSSSHALPAVSPELQLRISSLVNKMVAEELSAFTAHLQTRVVACVAALAPEAVAPAPASASAPLPNQVEARLEEEAVPPAGPPSAPPAPSSPPVQLQVKTTPVATLGQFLDIDDTTPPAVKRSPSTRDSAKRRARDEHVALMRTRSGNLKIDAGQLEAFLAGALPPPQRRSTKAHPPGLPKSSLRTFQDASSPACGDDMMMDNPLGYSPTSRASNDASNDSSNHGERRLALTSVLGPDPHEYGSPTAARPPRLSHKQSPQKRPASGRPQPPRPGHGDFSDSLRDGRDGEPVRTRRSTLLKVGIKPDAGPLLQASGPHASAERARRPASHKRRKGMNLAEFYSVTSGVPLEDLGAARPPADPAAAQSNSRLRNLRGTIRGLVNVSPLGKLLNSVSRKKTISGETAGHTFDRSMSAKTFDEALRTTVKLDAPASRTRRGRTNSLPSGVNSDKKAEVRHAGSVVVQPNHDSWARGRAPSDAQVDAPQLQVRIPEAGAAEPRPAPPATGSSAAAPGSTRPTIPAPGGPPPDTAPHPQPSQGSAAASYRMVEQGLEVGEVSDDDVVRPAAARSRAELDSAFDVSKQQPKALVTPQPSGPSKAHQFIEDIVMHPHGSEEAAEEHDVVAPLEEQSSRRWWKPSGSFSRSFSGSFSGSHRSSSILSDVIETIKGAAKTPKRVALAFLGTTKHLKKTLESRQEGTVVDVLQHFREDLAPADMRQTWDGRASRPGEQAAFQPRDPSVTQGSSEPLPGGQLAPLESGRWSIAGGGGTRFRGVIPISPRSKMRRSWDVLIFVVLIYCAYQLPYKMAMQPIDAVDAVFEELETVITTVFVIDILLNFLTAYEVNDMGHYYLITDLWAIAMLYARTWLLLDVVATVPWDAALQSVIRDNDQSTTDAFKLSKGARAMRLLRLIKISRKLEDVINPTYVRLGKLLAFMTMISHWVSCALIGVAKETADPDTWLSTQSFLEQDGTLQYGIALYWTFLTMLGNGSYPQDNLSVYFTLAIFLMGIVVFSSVFGSLVTLVNNMDAASIQYHEQMDRTINYLRILKVPRQLRHRIISHYEQIYERTNGVQVQVFLESLPRHLRQEMAIFVNRGVLESMEIFNNCSISFLTAILMQVRLQMFLEGDLVFCEGELGEDMYFIINGELNMWQEGSFVCVLLPGDYFGAEQINVNFSSIRSYSIRAVKCCTLYSLNRDAYNTVAEAYQHDSEMFEKQAMGSEEEEGEEEEAEEEEEEELEAPRIHSEWEV